MNYKIVNLIDEPKLKSAAARFFHDKWGIPIEEYIKSMDESLLKLKAVPQWYLAIEDNQIISGLGVIENDFHDRKDLSPNVCAVYVEENRRCLGIAGNLLNHACDDMKKRGISTLYLVTDHTSFYERYDWKFFCMVQVDEQPYLSRMYIHNN